MNIQMSVFLNIVSYDGFFREGFSKLLFCEYELGFQHRWDQVWERNQYCQHLIHRVSNNSPVFKIKIQSSAQSGVPLHSLTVVLLQRVNLQSSPWTNERQFAQLHDWQRLYVGLSLYNTDFYPIPIASYLSYTPTF